MTNYTQRPVEISAVRWDGSKVEGWYRGRFFPDRPDGPDWWMSVPNGLERDDFINPNGELLMAYVGDYIVTVSLDGKLIERRVYSPEVFAALYEPAQPS